MILFGADSVRFGLTLGRGPAAGRENLPIGNWPHAATYRDGKLSGRLKVLVYGAFGEIIRFSAHRNAKSSSA